MTDVSEGQWRWPLPDDWEPEGYWCVQITIPADQQYMDRLTGALGLLTLSKSWFPDPTRQGPKTVAQTWENALYLNMFSVNENCSVVPTPPIPNDAAADDAAAAIYTVFFQYIVSQLNTLAPTSGDCPDAVDSVMSDLAPYGASDAVRGTLARLCSDLNANPTERADFEGDCPYTDQYNALRQHIKDNPYDWLNSLSDFMFNWLNQTSSAIFNDLNTLAGLLGMGTQGFINDHGGIPAGGGASFGGSCAWEHTFDFTTGEHGWLLDTGAPSIAGEYIGGTGFHSTLNWDSSTPGTPGQEFNCGVTISMPDVGTFHITRFEIVYDATWGENNWGTESRVMYTSVYGGDYYPSAVSPYDHSGGADISSAFVELRVGYDPNSPPPSPAGDGTITSITIHGVGPADPFAGL